MANVFDIIKKQNGDEFAKAICNYDSGIFDIPGIEEIVKFAGSKAEPIMDHLIFLKNIKTGDSASTEDPFELLHRAGYVAEYADTLEKQNAIMKYFKREERLCTFRDSGRYKRYHIINAVKRDVDQIRRGDFPSPQREDAYGASVISIQILKNGGFIKITNRYNHTVENPDDTFSSNPDNIVPGLSDALKKHFSVDFASWKVAVPKGYVLVGKNIIKYNHEINNIYFGADFYVKDGVVHELDGDNQMMLDYFVFDAGKKELLNIGGSIDGFVPAFQEEIEGRKVQILPIKEKRKDGAGNEYDVRVGTRLTADGVCILETNRSGEISSLYFQRVRDIYCCFLFFNKVLVRADLPQAEEIGGCFLCCNQALSALHAPRVRKIDGGFLHDNDTLERVDLPQAEVLGNKFLYSNKVLKHLNVPRVKKFGENCLPYHKELADAIRERIVEAEAADWVAGHALSGVLVGVAARQLAQSGR